MYYGTYSAFYLYFILSSRANYIEFRAYFCHKFLQTHVAPLNIIPNNKYRRNSVLFIHLHGQHTFLKINRKDRVRYYQKRSVTSCYVFISSEKSTKIRIFEVHKKQQILKYCVHENILIVYLPVYHLRNSYGPHIRNTQIHNKKSF